LLLQLGIIERGILNYPISGVKSIETAIKQGMVDTPTTVRQPQGEGREDKVGRSKVGDAWKALHEAARAVVDTDKGLTVLATRLEQGLPWLEKGLALLP
jgi:hypothetical protein